MNAVLAEIRSLSVRYRQSKQDVVAVKPLDLDLLRGERVAVIGESGSGKSSFARALACLLPKHAGVTGTIRWPEAVVPPKPGKDIGFVFQDPGAALNPVLTVGEQVAEVFYTHCSMPWQAAATRAVQLFDKVGLADAKAIGGAFPHQLSGGQKQRVAIAAAIAAAPSLLIADEATSALDMVVQAQIVKLIQDLVEDEGMTLVFITHDMALAASLAQRICVFQAGELVELGASRALVEQPRHPYTAGLLAAHRDLHSTPLVGSLRS